MQDLFPFSKMGLFKFHSREDYRLSNIYSVRHIKDTYMSLYEGNKLSMLPLLDSDTPTYIKHLSAVYSMHYAASAISWRLPRIDISQYRLLFEFFLLYTDHVPFELQRSLPMKGELRWKGTNSISKFDHHNINGGAVDNKIRQVEYL
jgi:hypothetical protein